MDDKQLATQVLDGGRLRALVLELWQRTRMDWGFVTDRLAQTFRANAWIGSHERRFVGETLYGLVRHLRRIDLALERGRKQKQAPRDLERLVAYLVLEKLVDPARAARAEPDLDWRAVAGVDDAISRERDTTTRIALAASLPDWLARRLVADWGDEAEPLALALNQRAPMTVRANLLVSDRDSLAKDLARAGIDTHPGKHCQTALIVDTRTNLFALDAFKRGALEAQDEGSQLLAELVPAGKLIVDYCAGAGGKTLAIAARLANRGRIIATDVDPKKLDELRRRARRAKVSNAQAIAIEDGRWPKEVEQLRDKADCVFVDAPCSGIGALRRNPEARWRLRDADIADFARRQREIVAAAAQLAAPGAIVIYATCTLLRDENDAARGLSGLEPIPLSEVIGEQRALALGREGTLVVTPHQHGTDGFFAQVLRRH